VDEALESLRRAVKADPADVGAALRLASACERLRLFPEAWEVLVRRLSGAIDAPEDDVILRGLADLAAKSPAPLLRYLDRLERVEEARFSLRAVARSGELPVVIAIGCDEGRHAFFAQRLLRDALAVEGLPGVGVLGALLGGGQALVRMTPILRNLTGLEPEEMFREFGIPFSEEARAVYLGPAGGIAGMGALSFLQNIARPAGVPDWRGFARDLVARALGERRLELLPWLRAIAGAEDAAVAAQAVSAFQELSGRLAPPLDVADLASRWRAAR
jgi:hypothetical protein